MTVPEPTVCPTCKGDGYMTFTGEPCPECHCDRCGTDVYTRGEGPQLCNDCADDIGDRAYERSHDV